eukprot:a1327_958.p1 GENE.a1327_958~~a1327_958.p1  ORF type:complete len:140 (+),score=45.87 a1327_958:30-422(+)
MSTALGYVISALPAAAMGFSIFMKLSSPEFLHQWQTQLQLPAEMASLVAVIETVLLVCYFVPATSIAAAVGLSAVLGGAVSTHLRVQDSPLPPVILGSLFWLGLVLRNPAARVVIPFWPTDAGNAAKKTH